MLDIPAADTGDARLDALLLHQEVEQFNAAYAAALDEQRLTDWAEMFTDDAFYVVISRENADRGHAGRADLLRQQGGCSTTAPSRWRRRRCLRRATCATSSPTCGSGRGDAAARSGRAQTMHVFQVLYDRPDAKLHQVGVYHDVFRRVDGALKLAERRCIYDNLLVDNALCLPV